MACRAGACDNRSSGGAGESAVNRGTRAVADLAHGEGVERDPVPVPSQPLSPNIVVDQFGYRPLAEKIAVIRSPLQGYAAAPFAPGPSYAVVDARSGKAMLEKPPIAWHGGATDSSSGDKAWWVDFSGVTAPGTYFILDESGKVRSDVFRIADGVYDDVLAQVVRMFYYQRDGIVKDAKYAGRGWADAMAHPQDAQCHAYDTPKGGRTRDLRGGWFDAGDQNKYTNWGASDAIELLRAYRENPSAFTDSYNIPESGNGVPDLLDEAKWEIDWIARMQIDESGEPGDGSVLSIVAHPGKGDGNPLNQSPPSIDDGPCLYGPATTSASLSAAAVFAYAAIVFESTTAAGKAYPGYASGLRSRARRAWVWAKSHPSVTFCNQRPEKDVTCEVQVSLAGSNQEIDGEGRLEKELEAAVFLFELTGDEEYRVFFDSNYRAASFTYADMPHLEQNDTMLEYTRASKSTPSVVSDIQTKFKAAMQGESNFGSLRANSDPYLAYIFGYWWGSNGQKAAQGNLFYDVISFGTDATEEADAARGAERYIHYLNGVNPLGLVYLSNMKAFGAARSVTRFYHSWFAHGSRDWDTVGVSTYGPPPGYLPGGPNPFYTWDACCPWNCGGWLREPCGAAVLSPPAGQPNQKAYLQFNDGWPINSWEITEPSDAYQAPYVRLLSKFVRRRPSQAIP
jgi:hypothetical protein